MSTRDDSSDGIRGRHIGFPRRGRSLPVSDLQEQVQEAIDRAVSSGAERGVQVAAYQDGEPLVQAVAGIADPETGRAVTPDTPFYNFSIVKGAASTVAHILAERGLFGYDTPVVELWPEFGALGKQAVTVRHVLNHSAGVPGIPLDTTPEDLCDWDKMCAAIAGAELWWEPGTKVGYTPTPSATCSVRSLAERPASRS